jgi:hypothetical protein
MAAIEVVYERFLRGEIAVAGKDFNDMTTGGHGTDPKGYAVVNVMLPRRSYPAWQGNIVERRRGFTHSHNDAGEVLDSVDGLQA